MVVTREQISMNFTIQIPQFIGTQLFAFQCKSVVI